MILNTPLNNQEDGEDEEMNAIQSAGLKLIMEGCKLMGWQIAFEEMQEDEIVDGFIIGSPEFIDRILPEAPDDPVGE